MSRRLALAAVTLVVALVPVGSAVSSRTATSYPVTITTPAGSVTIPKKPKRIVSLSATATESLFAIGAGPQVIAVDNQSDYPKSAPKTTLSGFTPNVEAIAGYKPDLVVISYDPKGLSDALRTLGIPVIHHDAAKSLKGAYQQIGQLGKVTDRGVQATAVVTRMKEQIAKILASSRARANGLTVYHELTPDLYSVTSGTFIGRVYSASGTEEHRRCGRLFGVWLPPALERVRRQVEPRSDRARRHGVLRRHPRQRRWSPGLEHRRGGQDRVDRSHRRLDRFPLGAAARELLPGDVDRVEAPEAVS